MIKVGRKRKFVKLTLDKGHFITGEGSVIGAGSVVTKDIPPMVVAAGNPCRVIREVREDDKIQPEDLAF